ncbi:MAG TPA: transporter [Flavobacterium sp.]|nr:transporter [Flavobacterium sp.]
MQISRFLILAMICISSKGFSQEKAQEPIATDRPDQTETPDIVPKGMFQMETGVSLEKAGRDSESFAIPSTLLKYGLNGRFEFRLIAEFVTDKTDGTQISGLNPIVVGFKVAVCDEKGILPKTSFLGHLQLPDLASSDLKTTFYAPEFRFTMQHTLSDKIDLGYNLGAEWDGETAEPTFIYTLTTGISLSEKTGCFIEVYGFAPQKDKADHRFDCGFTYLISNNCMVDASGGFGITENAPDYFAAVGFSFRL